MDQVKMLPAGGLLDRRARFKNLSIRLIQLLCEGSTNDPRREANQTANHLYITHILEIQRLSCRGLSPSQPTDKGRKQLGMFP